MIDLPGHLAGALDLNCPEFPESCSTLDFARFVEVSEVFADRSDIDVEQPRHRLLRQPDRLVLVAHFESVPARLGGEDEKLGGGVADVLLVGHLGWKVFQRTVFISPAKARLILREAFGAEILDPAGVVDGLGDDVAWGLVAFEFDEDEGGVGGDGEEVDAAAAEGDLLTTDEHPFVRDDARIGRDHVLEELFAGELGDGEGSRGVSDGPDGVFDGHGGAGVRKALWICWSGAGEDSSLDSFVFPGGGHALKSLSLSA